jgi:hypothetical protein
MILCHACQEAIKSPSSGMYHADCMDCQARMLSKSPAHFESARLGKITAEYRAALLAVFGNDWLEGHQKVKAWAANK